MQNVTLKDERLLNTILDMLVSEIGISTVMDEELLSHSTEYQEARSRVETIENILREAPETADLVESYVDACIQAENLYDRAVFIKGIKTGFNLHLFVDQKTEEEKNDEQNY